MAQPKKTLYQILGVPRDASAEDIGLAHEMKSAEMQRAQPPDPGGVALVNEAHRILTNPDRRAAYDNALAMAAQAAAAAQQAQANAPDTDLEAEADDEDRKRKIRLLSMVGGMAVVLIGLFFAFRPKAPAPQPPAEPVSEAAKPAAPAPPRLRTPTEIVADATTSSGQVLSYSMSGSATSVGIALAIEPNGQMVTTCHGLPAGSKLVVKVGAQMHPADLTITDEELDLCRLSVAGFTTPPLKLAPEDAKAGDKVYAVSINAKGELAAAEAKVNQVRTTPRGKVLEVSVPFTAGATGGGVFNEQGQLVGVATTPHEYGAGLNVALPVSWIAEMRSRATPAK